MTTDFRPTDYWEQRLGQEFSLAGVGFAGLGGHYNRWLYRVRRVVFRRAMASLPESSRRPARVLDVGCGTGFYIDQWRAAGAAEVAGCDLTSVAVRNLASRFPDCRFYQCDIGEAVPGIPGSWDSISAFDVLFHIVDDQRFARAVSNIHALLKPGGCFLFSDNFLHGPEKRLAHQVHRTLTHIERVVGGAGFEIVGRLPMFCLMNYPIDSDSRLRQRTWNSIARLIALADPVGAIAGALLYPVELCLTALVSEAASTELMICRKPNA